MAREGNRRPRVLQLLYIVSHGIATPLLPGRSLRLRFWRKLPLLVWQLVVAGGGKQYYGQHPDKTQDEDYGGVKSKLPVQSH